MVSASLTRWREIEQTFRDCPDCKKDHFTHDWLDVTPCAVHKPLAKELQRLAEPR